MYPILNNIGWRRRFLLLLIPFLFAHMAATALALDDAEVRLLKAAVEAGDFEAIADMARANPEQSAEIARVAAGFAPARAADIAGAVACAVTREPCRCVQKSNQQEITGMGTCTVNPEYAVEIAAVLAREFPELATQIARKCRACICPLAEKIDRAVGEAIVVMPPETPPGVPPTHYHQ